MIGDHKLRLLFEDGTVGDISFEDHDWHGVFEPLRDPARFAKVTSQYGTIVWPEYDLDIAPSRSTKPHGVTPSRPRQALADPTIGHGRVDERLIQRRFCRQKSQDVPEMS